MKRCRNFVMRAFVELGGESRESRESSARSRLLEDRGMRVGKLWDEGRTEAEVSSRIHLVAVRSKRGKEQP